MSINAHPFSITLCADDFEPAAISDLILTDPKANFRVMFLEGDMRKRLAEEAGFLLVRKTWCGDVQLSDIDMDALMQAEKQSIEQNLKIGSLSNDRINEWVLAHETVYRACHQANPLAPLDDAGRQSVFAGSDFRQDAAFAAILEGQIVAHSSLRETEQGWEFGWFGSVSGSREFQKMLNCVLKQRELVFANQIGLQSLYLELDSTDDQAMDMASVLPIRNPEVWLTFQNRARFMPAN